MVGVDSTGAQDDANERWFDTAFDLDYLERYAHRDDTEALRMLELFDRAAQLPDGARILDLGCGGGRHARQFTARGYDVVGLDLSEPLLLEALRLQPDGERRPRYVRGEMMHLPFRDAVFDGVANLFTTFGYYSEDADNEAVIAEASRVLRPGGIFFFDFINLPWLRRTLAPASESRLPDGTRSREHRWLTPPPVRVEKRVRLYDDDGRLMLEQQESVRAFSREELQAIFAAHGLEILKTYGGYSGEPWNEATPRLIFLARKLRHRAG